MDTALEDAMNSALEEPEGFAKIVVIDDDWDSLAYLTTLLSRVGIRCAAFRSSADALDYIRTHPVSVVVTDIFMPQVDGVQLIAAIRGCRPKAAVIAISGYQESYLRCMRALGATGGLSKPVDPATLVAMINRCLDPAFSGDLCQA